MTADEEIQLVTFRIGAHVFAFSVLEVERVLRYEAPAPLPDAPDFLDGILQQGDDVVPVIDLRRRLNVEAATREETRIVLVDWDDGKVGLVVDEVLELLKIPVSEVTAPPKIVQGLAAEFVNIRTPPLAYTLNSSAMEESFVAINWLSPQTNAPTWLAMAERPAAKL